MNMKYFENNLKHFILLLSIFMTFTVFGISSITELSFEQNTTDTDNKLNSLMNNKSLTNVDNKTDNTTTFSSKDTAVIRNASNDQSFNILEIQDYPSRDMIINSNVSTMLRSLIGSFGLIPPVDAICTTLDGTTSSDIGLNDQTPCTVSLSNSQKNIDIDVKYEIIQNDDSDDITVFSRQNQQPETFVFTPGEFLIFTKNGGKEYDFLDVYLVDQKVEDGEILRLEQDIFSRVFLDHFVLFSSDILRVPEIEDGNSVWKLVVNYENNDELESYFIANNVIIE